MVSNPVLGWIQNTNEGHTVHYLSPCYEIFRQIQTNLKNLQFTGNWEWIKSHRETSNNPKHELNAKVDLLAKQYMTKSHMIPDLHC